MANVKMSDLRDRYKKRQEKSDEKTDRGTFITEPGRFRVKMTSSELRQCLDKDKLKKGIKDKNWNAGIFNFKILISDNPKYPKGSSATWFVKDPQESNLSDIERLMWALQGYNPGVIKGYKDADSDEYEQYRLLADVWGDAALNDAEALEVLGFEPGFISELEVELETRLTDTKSGGKFTVHVWTPTPEAAASPIPLLDLDAA